MVVVMVVIMIVGVVVSVMTTTTTTAATATAILKYCPVLNLTQHVEDGFETEKITNIVIVDLSAAYRTVHHQRCVLLQRHTMSC